MVNWILTQWANIWFAIGLYWLPASFCAVFYTVRTARNYVMDRARREKAAASEAWDRDNPGKRYAITAPQGMPEYASYSPTDTVGTLIGRALVSVLPVANLWAACFDLAPDVFSKLLDWFERVFSQPLVPKIKP